MFSSKRFFLRALFIIFILSFINTSAQPEAPKREMRGVWIATVANIDWPASRTGTSEEKINYLKDMLISLKSMGINTVFFQVRTECDALYNSKYEPWSYWLTGAQGTAPDPYFDPLQVAIDESHKLGMELHAWFNPYRAVKTPGAYPAAANHVSVVHPDWLLTFKDYTMLNPGLPEVQESILQVMDDVLTRYDIDGIHFDDYFYPYGPKVSTEDTATFHLYPRGFTDIDDWRRDNINSLMKNIYLRINQVKPFVKFGISPFGIVENKYAGTNGFESYKILYCDPLNWIQNKIVDYVLPQLYWDMNHAKAPFAKLLPWWKEVTTPALLFVGHYSSSFLGDNYDKNPNELEDQINMIRATVPNSGSVFFSAKSLTRNIKGFADSLRYVYYRYPALQPLMPWKDSIPPEPVKHISVKFENSYVTIEWDRPQAGSEPLSGYAIYRFYSFDDIDLSNVHALRAVVPASQNTFSEYIFSQATGYTYVITALDRLQNESRNNAEVKLEFK